MVENQEKMVKEQKLDEDLQQEQYQEMFEEQLEILEDHFIKKVSYYRAKEEKDEEEDQTEEQEETSEAESEKLAGKERAAAMGKIWSRKIDRKRKYEEFLKDDLSDGFESLEANQVEPTDFDHNWEIEEELSSIKLFNEKLFDSVKAKEDRTKQHILTSLGGKSRHKRKEIGCSICSFKTISKGHFTKHMKSKHGEDCRLKIFVCDYCNYTTTQEGHLKRHKDAKHEGVKYPCKLCDQQFTIKDALRRHVENKHQGTRFPCPHCNFLSTTISNLKYHIECKHTDQSYSCDLCDFETNTKKNLKVHKSTIHEDVFFICSEVDCDYQAKDQSSLRYHMNATHGGTRLTCKICGNCYTKITTLRNHIKSKHSENRD